MRTFKKMSYKQFIKKYTKECICAVKEVGIMEITL